MPRRSTGLLGAAGYRRRTASSGGSPTGGSGGPLTDRTSVSYNNGTKTSTYHIYANGLDWTQRVGLLVYGDGSGEQGLSDPGSTYLMAGTNGLINVAKRHNMVLVTPRAPGNGCTDGDGVCWYLPSNDGTTLAQKTKWLDDLVKTQVLSLYNIDKTRVCIAGFSSGAELTMGTYSPQYAASWMDDGLLLGISYGSSPDQYGVANNYTAGFRANVAAVWDVRAGDETTAVEDSEEGFDWYVAEGFATTDINIIPGGEHDRPGEFGGIVDQYVTAHVTPASLGEGGTALAQLAPDTSLRSSLSSSSEMVLPTPKGMKPGLLRIVWFSISNQTITTPTGWALIPTFPQVFATTRRIYGFYRVYQTGDVAPTFVFSGTANYTCIQTGARKYNAAAPFSVTPQFAAGTSGTTLTAPTVTTVDAGSLLMTYFASISNLTTDTLSVPAGMTTARAKVGTGVSGHSGLLATESRPTTGGTGTRVSTAGVSAPWAAVTVVLSPGAADGTGTAVGTGRDYFPAADWYWSPIPASPVLDTNSAAIVSILAGGTHSAAINFYAAHLIHASDIDGATPRYTIPMRHDPTGDLDLWGANPFQGIQMPLPDGTHLLIPPGEPPIDPDGHVSANDPILNYVFNVWQMTSLAGPPRTYGASWGGISDGDGDGIEDPLRGISTGAGLSRYGGPIRESEIQAALNGDPDPIPHALFFGTTAAMLRGSNVLNTNYRYPASNTDGSNQGGHATTVMEGARVQLNPSVNVDAISGISVVQKAVAKALQKYGAYVGDNGGSRMGFIFERKPGSTVYASAGLTEYLDMTHIPWSSLRVLRRWDGL
jgi:hypothetical protein